MTALFVFSPKKNYLCSVIQNEQTNIAKLQNLIDPTNIKKGYPAIKRNLIDNQSGKYGVAFNHKLYEEEFEN